MTETYGVKAQATLLKASVAEDEGAVDVFSNALSLCDPTEEDFVLMADVDEGQVRVEIDFIPCERSHGETSGIMALVDAMSRHALTAFRVEGENVEDGRFVEVLGPQAGRMDLAVEVGKEQAAESLPFPANSDARQQIKHLMRWAGESQCQALDHLLASLEQHRERLPASVQTAYDAAKAQGAKAA